MVIKEWDKLDQNRERRERNYEHLRGDLPLDYQAVSEPKLIPRWMNDTAYRQMMAGNFLDILFNCPYEMHQLTADPFLSKIVERLKDEHKEVLYFLSLRLYSTAKVAVMRGRNLIEITASGGILTHENYSISYMNIFCGRTA